MRQVVQAAAKPCMEVRHNERIICHTYWCNFRRKLCTVKFLGICPFLGVSKKTSTAVGMSRAVVLLWFFPRLLHGLLTISVKTEQFGISQTIAFILTIASLVQLVEIVLKKMIPSLYKALGVYLPLITTNCAVLGSHFFCGAGLYLHRSSSIWICSRFGLTLALILFSGVRET